MLEPRRVGALQAYLRQAVLNRIKNELRRKGWSVRVRLGRMPGAELVSRGREAFARRAWADAFESLSRADQAGPLEAKELELLATSAYMLGRDDEQPARARARPIPI